MPPPLWIQLADCTTGYQCRLIQNYCKLNSDYVDNGDSPIFETKMDFRNLHDLPSVIKRSDAMTSSSVWMEDLLFVCEVLDVFMLRSGLGDHARLCVTANGRTLLRVENTNKCSNCTIVLDLEGFVNNPYNAKKYSVTTDIALVAACVVTVAALLCYFKR